MLTRDINNHTSNRNEVKNENCGTGRQVSLQCTNENHAAAR